MSPWPDINYMVDESWARYYPYGSEIKRGEVLKLSLRITNHASKQMVYKASWNIPEGWKILNAQQSAAVPAHSDGELTAQFNVGEPGLRVVTADISFDNWQLPRWTEALVRVR